MRPEPALRDEAARAERGRGAVLVVDDEELLLRALERILRPEGHEVRCARSVADARPLLDDPALDVVLVDLMLGEASGLELLDHAAREALEVEVIVMTGHATVESAVGCMRRGAFDYLAKPFDDVHRVRAAVRQAVERRQLVRRNRELERELRERGGAPSLVGRSARLRALQRKVESLRHNESNVLLQGESGTGKELVARALHAASPRSAGPFVPVDCGALPESIIESELFGHERGAFTGAVGAPGLFRRAHRGTLFLDEVGEIPLAMQARLLRALQSREVRPVGGSDAVPVDIRVIAATNRDLAAMVEEGRFRLDLYYRLNVVRIDVPPLRERMEDVPLLAAHFLAKHARPGQPGLELEPDALERLARYAWPGNVRELENAIESALALARGPRLRAADLPLGVPAAAEREAPPAHIPLDLDAYERCALERALLECGGDATEAARRLGIGRSTLYRKLARHSLRPGRALSSGPAIR
ncbi:MAG TPA: sigma-54 dependent transcriptional regulator [Myxococcota bacterium]|nr:sigma-54 dependent transcriptional regulator [Myxococcota bacterium]